MISKSVFYKTLLLAAVIELGILAGIVFLVQENRTDLIATQKRLDDEIAVLSANQDILIEQNEQLVTVLRDDLETLRSETNQKIAGTTQQLVATRSELSREIENKEIVAATTNSDAVADAVAAWHPRIGFIRCTFRNSLGAEVSLRGSATLFSDSGTPKLISNKHVLSNGLGSTLLNCYYRFPLDSENITFREDNITLHPLLDYGEVVLTAPNSYVTSQLKSVGRSCTEPARIGDAIVILGFPNIGSETDITATEGIISGFDGDHYISSAKVDVGNSGGAAIHVNNNCYLGIPTSSQAGTLESLARILDINAVE